MATKRSIMQTMISKYLWILIPGIAGFLLSGCLGTNPVTPTRYYLLNPTAYDSPLVTSADTPLSVEISALHLPQYLEKPKLSPGPVRTGW